MSFRCKAGIFSFNFSFVCIKRQDFSRDFQFSLLFYLHFDAVDSNCAGKETLFLYLWRKNPIFSPTLSCCSSCFWLPSAVSFVVVFFFFSIMEVVRIFGDAWVDLNSKIPWSLNRGFFFGGLKFWDCLNHSLAHDSGFFLNEEVMGFLLRSPFV